MRNCVRSHVHCKTPCHDGLGAALAVLAAFACCFFCFCLFFLFLLVALCWSVCWCRCWCSCCCAAGCVRAVCAAFGGLSVGGLWCVLCMWWWLVECGVWSWLPGSTWLCSTAQILTAMKSTTTKDLIHEVTPIFIAITKDDDDFDDNLRFDLPSLLAKNQKRRFR